MGTNRIIKNRLQLETTELRRKALDIIEDGIIRVLPSSLMQNLISFKYSTRTLFIKNDVFHLDGRIFIVGGGKASGSMAQELEKIIGPENINDGIIAEKSDPAEFDIRRVKVIQTGHPVPDSRGLYTAKQIFNLKEKHEIGKEDIVLCLLSGGFSALIPYPIDGISLKDKQQITRLLLSCGASIYEINTVRKHLSRIKGGRLAEHFAPAKVISLIVSDVVGDDMSFIASGPTCPDKSTYSESLNVLEKYKLTKKISNNALSLLEQGCNNKLAETPKSLSNVANYIVGDNRLALNSMSEKARYLGFKPLVLTSEQIGDTESAAVQRAKEILEGNYKGYDALIIGGETTPTLPSKHGKGGRNQHYAACTLPLFDGYPDDWALACVGTDGSDFIPDVAGAIVDRECFSKIKLNVPDFEKMIECYDSNTLLSYTGNSLIITGNTHTNVGDIILYLLQTSDT